MYDVYAKQWVVSPGGSSVYISRLGENIDPLFRDLHIFPEGIDRHAPDLYETHSSCCRDGAVRTK